MTEFKPGDIVDIEIRGAEVVRDDGSSLVTKKPWFTAANIRFLTNHESVTIKKRSPEVRTGDVWRTVDGELWAVTSVSEGYWFLSLNEFDNCKPENFPLEGAELLTRLPEER